VPERADITFNHHKTITERVLKKREYAIPGGGQKITLSFWYGIFPK
jgi:hypothetical protein